MNFYILVSEFVAERFVDLIFSIFEWGTEFEMIHVERPIFRNFKITNIKIGKDQFFDYFIYEFIFL